MEAWPVYLAVLVAGAVVAGALSFSFVGGSLAALGIPDPGPLTTAGLPALRGIAWLLAALSAGSFIFSAFMIPPNGTKLVDAPLTVDGHLTARTASWASAGQALIAVLMIPLVLSDVSGTPLGDEGKLMPASLQVLATRIRGCRRRKCRRAGSRAPGRSPRGW